MTQLDLNDGETLAFYDRLLMFRGDSTKDDMIFPENLSGRQRRILHLIADKLSLYHFSEGEGNVRRLIIMKTPPPNAVMEAPAPRSPKVNMRLELETVCNYLQCAFDSNLCSPPVPCLLATSHVLRRSWKPESGESCDESQELRQRWYYRIWVTHSLIVSQIHGVSLLSPWDQTGDHLPSIYS